MLERPGEVADVGGGAQQVGVGLQHVDHPRRQRRPDDDVDALDLLVAGPRQDRLEHRLHPRRGRVVHHEQRGASVGRHSPRLRGGPVRSSAGRRVDTSRPPGRPTVGG
ncbi:hypothetical protein [Ornithinimicrobium kibberense]|uniref:hypothetical protein n=1 Tax=Ornithinimicrobium kibberense TaxID=282060 RepID=UPI0036147DC9